MKYQKQEKIIGRNGQAQIEQKKVLIVGIGALGSVVADMMARAGVGILYLIDGDLVQESNLHRQQLYTEKDAENEIPKVFAAEHVLNSINSACTIIPIFEELNEYNASSIIEQVDLVIDGTDNLATRYLINDICIQTDTPWVYGAASGTVGTYFTFIPNQTPCFRCVFGNMEGVEGANCSTQGVLPSITHYVATMQFNEAMKYLTGNLHLISKQMQRHDIWQNQQMKMTVKKRENCSCQHPKNIKVNIQNNEPFELKTLCGKEVIMARIKIKDMFVSQYSWLQQKLEEKHIPYIHTPYFKSVMIQETKMRLFQDGRIYFYYTDKEKAKNILQYLIS